MMSSETADVALIGLAVMGQNLVLNMNDHGYTVAVYNRTTDIHPAIVLACIPAASAVAGRIRPLPLTRLTTLASGVHKRT